MSIRVELFGIARRRAGVDHVWLNVNSAGSSLGELLGELARRFPSFAEACLDGERLRRGFVANQNGDRFVSDPSTKLQDGDTLLIMSADAGG